MEIPEIDERRKEDILSYIKEVSSVYVPEWRFDEENPDAGTALAFIFADMFAKTIKKLNQIPLKNQISFFNTLDAKMLPALASSGYVQFGLVNQEQKGVMVAEGTRVLSKETDEEGKNLVFETTEEVYVTPAMLDNIFCVSGEQDKIAEIYNRKEAGALFSKPCYFFQVSNPNLQEHVMYFGQEELWSVKGACEFTLQFHTQFCNPMEKELLAGLGDKRIALFEYDTEDGFCAFGQQEAIEQGILLKKEAGQKPFIKTVLEGREAFWLRCTLREIQPLKDFYINTIEVNLEGKELPLEAVIGNGREQDVNVFSPFGEQFSLYNEVYLGSEEVFSKKGARVQLCAELDFAHIPMESTQGNIEIDWKLVMKASRLQFEQEYDITIEEVVWEYYNGAGWRRLLLQEQAGEVFLEKEKNQVLQLTFLVPEDIQAVTIEGCQSFFLRAKILKINHAYKTKGYYISPILKNARLSYAYEDKKIIPSVVLTKNNLEERAYEQYSFQKGGKGFFPFVALDKMETAMYLGFELAPLEGPIKLLFSVKEGEGYDTPHLIWEYLAQQEWKSLSVIDETEHMRQTGIVTFMGKKDFKKKRLFGKERYWIRIFQETYKSKEQKRGTKVFPCISNIFMNGVKIVNKEKKEREHFFVCYEERNSGREDLLSCCFCELSHKKIQEAHVWVEEGKGITQKEMEQLAEEERIEKVYDQAGVLQEVWVKWEEAEELFTSSKLERHYALDKNQGRIFFSNQRKRNEIEKAGKLEVRVDYAVGGGMEGNLEKGSITRLEKSIGFINYIDNPEITFGGCNQETLEQAMRRSADLLKHRNRAVTKSDYEKLAQEVNCNITKVKCFSNYNVYGEKEYGKITLVVLQNHFLESKKHFDFLRRQIREHIEPCMDSNVREMEHFEIIQPVFIALDIKVDVIVESFHMVLRGKTQIEKKLKEFLDPMTGNFDGEGWNIGTIPNETQLLNCLRNIKGVVFLRNIFITAYKEEGDKRIEIDLRKLPQKRYALPVNGIHEINVMAES